MRIIFKKRNLSKLVFVCSLVPVVIILYLYLCNIIRWGDTPELGFAFRTATGIKMVAAVRDDGRKAGLQVGDRILKVNGKAFNNITEFRSALNREAGENNTYLVERGRKQFEATITNQPLGFKTAFIRSGFPYLVGLTYVLIAILVFLMKPYHRTTWVFFLFSAVFGLYLTFLIKIDELRPFWLSTLHMFLYTFSPAVFIHMAMSFPEERMLIKKHSYTQLIPYLPSTILFAFMRAITPEMWNLPKMWRIIAVAYMVLAILIYLGSCLQLWLTSQSEIVKVRAKMILLGVTLTASIPLFENLMNAIFGIFIVPSINYYLPFLIIFPLSLGFSIVKYNLFDFDAIIRRSFGYILLTGGISAIYALSLYLFNLVFGRFEIAESPLFPLLFVLAVVFLFNPVRNQAQKFIDRVFFRLEYDYQEVIHKISETMRSLLSLDQIGKYIMDTALGTMFIDSGRLMLLNPQEQVFECLTTKDKEPAFFDAKSPIINQVAESRANHPEQVRDRKVGLKSLVTANKGWVDQYGFAINIGIGINTGEVFLGNIGSPERMEFTVIGDPVNIASRFSGMARPGQILVTKETLKCLDSEIAYRELPPMEVKGKTGKLEVFEMIYS